MSSTRTSSICLADSNKEHAALLIEALTQHNYDALPAASGAEALKVCQDNDIDLILACVSLSDMTGYELLQNLNDNPGTENLSVILITDEGAPQDISRGYSMGAVHCISKPYNLPVIMTSVADAIGERQAHNLLHYNPQSSYIDQLTGLKSRNYLMERLQEEVDKAHRYGFPVSCVVMDVDDVKPLDDELGPVSLDDLLVEVAMTIRSYSRTYDILGRYDATLFASVLPHAPIDDAVSYTKKIMEELNATTFSDPNFPTHTQISAGIVTCSNGVAHGADFVFGEAMRGLLQAKSRPKDRLVARDLNQ